MSGLPLSYFKDMVQISLCRDCAAAHDLIEAWYYGDKYGPVCTVCHTRAQPECAYAARKMIISFQVSPRHPLLQLDKIGSEETLYAITL